MFPIGFGKSIIDSDFVILLFGSESMLTTQSKISLSSSWFSVPCPLGGLPSRITNLCIPGKNLSDDALPAATSGFNNHDTDNIYPLGEFGDILSRGMKNTSLERGISTYEAEKQRLGKFNDKLIDHKV